MGRRLTYYHDEDGSLVLKVQLPAEAGALVLKALEAVSLIVSVVGEMIASQPGLGQAIAIPHGRIKGLMQND